MFVEFTGTYQKVTRGLSKNSTQSMREAGVVIDIRPCKPAKDSEKDGEEEEGAVDYGSGIGSGCSEGGGGEEDGKLCKGGRREAAVD